MLQLPPTNPVCGKDKEPKLKDPKTGWATDREVADYFGCSRSQVWHLIRTHPTFPQPINYGWYDTLVVAKHFSMGQNTYL